MADRIADNADLVVDEMKRKARRRLIGAIVLALAAAIILPLLLEKEPRPLGDDVSVQIPPVDEGKFVNRLTGRASDTKPLPKAELKTDPKAPSTKPAPASETAGEGALPPKSTSPAPPAPAASTTSEPGAPRKSAVEADQTALSPSAKPVPIPARAALAPDVKSGTKPASGQANPTTAVPAQAAPPTSAAAPIKPEGLAVQLAAFADDKGANALANKLKKVGYAAYVEPVETSRGTLWRVRVGGYESRIDAEAARVKLKSEGYSGIVAPVK